MVFIPDILDKNKSGIYCILNTINGKFYIGSTINFWIRYKQHKNSLNSRSHHSIFLQRAIDKYGMNNFQFHILEVCLSENLLNKEQNYLKTLCSSNRNIGYNIEGDVQRRSEETIAKIIFTRKKNGNSEKFKKHLEVFCKNRLGSTISQQQKDAIVKKAKGRKWTVEHRRNNDISRQKPIVSFDWLGYPIEQFDSLKQCAIAHRVTSATLSPIVRNRLFWREKVLVFLNKE